MSNPFALMILSRYSSMLSGVSFTRERLVSFYTSLSLYERTFFVKGHVFFGFRFSTLIHESYLPLIPHSRTNPITWPYGLIVGFSTGIIVMGSM